METITLHTLSCVYIQYTTEMLIVLHDVANIMLKRERGVFFKAGRFFGLQ